MGLTDIVPEEGFTGWPLIVAEVAPLIVHESVEVCPRTMQGGLALKVICGSGKVTVIVLGADSALQPPELDAEAV